MDCDATDTQKELAREASCFQTAMNDDCRFGAKKCKKIDTCVIRTHAPEGNAWLEIAGHRVNHSAKVPCSG
jgi:hypothetical protein